MFLSVKHFLFKNVSPDYTELVWLENISNFALPESDLLSLLSSLFNISMFICGSV